MLAGTSAPAFAADEPATIEEIDARIQAIESALLQAQAERFREKHRLEYNDPTASSQYQAAKRMEKEVLDLRRDYNDRLRVIDADLRDQEKEIARMHKAANELSQLSGAIQREMTTLEVQNAPEMKDQIAILKEELEQTDRQISELRKQAMEKTAVWTERKRVVAAGDPEASELSDRLQEAEANYRRQFGDLHKTMDHHPDVQALDTKRQELAAELQKLMEQRRRLNLENQGE